MYRDNWKEKHKDHLLVYQRAWRKKNKERFGEANKRSRIKRWAECPWLRHRHHAMCNTRGIKHEMTIPELKSIWFRDKAYQMDRPTIDRIDPRSHYTKDNVQFLEFKDNVSKSNKSREREPNGRFKPGRDYYPESRK